MSKRRKVIFKNKATDKIDLASLIGKNVNTKSVSLAKSITPYDIFLRCIKRAENLINFHSDDKNPNEEHFCDAYRASVVLTIAALDAYTRTVAIIKIKEKLSKSPKITDPLCQYIKSIMTHDGLLESAISDTFFEEIDRQISDDFQKKSFQGERKITHYMELAGYKNIFGLVAKKNNSNEHNLKEGIEKFTKRRHTIAHGGDYDINQIPYKELTINKDFAKECLKIVKDFTKTLNEICFK
jgi:hypothetical protein